MKDSNAGRVSRGRGRPGFEALRRYAAGEGGGEVGGVDELAARADGNCGDESRSSDLWVSGRTGRARLGNSDPEVVRSRLSSALGGKTHSLQHARSPPSTPAPHAAATTS